jgi:hypothetical protein
MQNLKAREQQQKIYDILSNPNKFSGYVNKWFQPMGAAETAAVHRDLGSNWATMTGGAPGGAMNQYVTDALAKIESQRYQSAASSALEALKGSLGGIPGMSPMGGTAGILNSLMILQALRGKKETPPSTMPPPTTETPPGPGVSEDLAPFQLGGT